MGERGRIAVCKGMSAYEDVVEEIREDVLQLKRRLPQMSW